MPLTPKGEEIQGAMKKEYGPKKGEQVFYASKNAGTIKGVDSGLCGMDAISKNTVIHAADSVAELFNPTVPEREQ